MALALVFWPLMESERLSGNEREYHTWLAEWIIFDSLLATAGKFAR